MKNRYGVDITYFHRWFDRALKDLINYTPQELARELARMSRTADESVLLEHEFAKDLIEANKNEFINGVAGVLAYILDNGEAISEEDLQIIGSIVLEKRGIEDKPEYVRLYPEEIVGQENYVTNTETVESGFRPYTGREGIAAGEFSYPIYKLGGE